MSTQRPTTAEDVRVFRLTNDLAQRAIALAKATPCDVPGIQMSALIYAAGLMARDMGMLPEHFVEHCGRAAALVGNHENFVAKAVEFVGAVRA